RPQHHYDRLGPQFGHHRPHRHKFHQPLGPQKHPLQPRKSSRLRPKIQRRHYHPPPQRPTLLPLQNRTPRARNHPQRQPRKSRLQPHVRHRLQLPNRTPCQNRPNPERPPRHHHHRIHQLQSKPHSSPRFLIRPI